MKLQRTTIILILLALGLGSFVYFYEIRGATQREEAQQRKQIFSFAEKDIQSLTVTTKNSTIILERTTSNAPSNWLIKSPIVAPAANPVVSYLTDLLVKGRVERTLSINSNQLNEFGLAPAQATIEVKLSNQKTYQMLLGKLDFNRRFLYAQIDPTTSNQNTNVLLVSTDFANAVNRELSEWQQTVKN